MGKRDRHEERTFDEVPAAEPVPETVSEQPAAPVSEPEPDDDAAPPAAGRPNFTRAEATQRIGRVLKRLAPVDVPRVLTVIMALHGE